MKTKVMFISILLLGMRSYSQMVFSENLNTYIDSTKTVQGMISPFFEFKTENKNIVTFKNLANFNILIKNKRVINLINKFELSQYGRQVTLSSGYIHTEFRYLVRKATELYPYFESQWAESRSMLYKISTGLQSRHLLFHNENHLLFTNVALFFEYEKWRVNPENAPSISNDSRSIKLHYSLSYKYVLNKKWEIITTGIFQTKPDAEFIKPRYASAFDLKYYITTNVGIRTGYRIIYDTAPIVPVPKTYTTFESSLDISF